MFSDDLEKPAKRPARPRNCAHTQANTVNWNEEAPCFHTVALALARTYAELRDVDAARRRCSVLFCAARALKEVR